LSATEAALRDAIRAAHASLDAAHIPREYDGVIFPLAARIDLLVALVGIAEQSQRDEYNRLLRWVVEP
jgi:hypothetical protein